MGAAGGLLAVVAAIAACAPLTEAGNPAHALAVAFGATGQAVAIEVFHPCQLAVEES